MDVNECERLSYSIFRHNKPVISNEKHNYLYILCTPFQFPIH